MSSGGTGRIIPMGFAASTSPARRILAIADVFDSTPAAPIHGTAPCEPSRLGRTPHLIQLSALRSVTCYAITITTRPHSIFPIQSPATRRNRTRKLNPRIRPAQASNGSSCQDHDHTVGSVNSQRRTLCQEDLLPRYFSLIVCAPSPPSFEESLRRPDRLEQVRTEQDPATHMRSV